MFPEPLLGVNTHASFPLVSKRVLVESYIEGETLSSMLAADVAAEAAVSPLECVSLEATHATAQARAARNKELARMGLQAFLTMLLKHNFVHADLHPGNIIVQRVASGRDGKGSSSSSSGSSTSPSTSSRATSALWARTRTTRAPRLARWRERTRGAPSAASRARPTAAPCPTPCARRRRGGCPRRSRRCTSSRKRACRASSRSTRRAARCTRCRLGSDLAEKI